MPVHPLVTQLRFTRSELMRCLEGVSAEDATSRLAPMNCISWIVGHVADQEAKFWLAIPQGDSSYKWLNELVGYGKPASTPPLAEMLAAWREITARADVFLDTLDTQKLLVQPDWRGRPYPETHGTMLQRCIYHIWFHTGEAYAIRQMLGHSHLPEFIGGMENAGYQPE